MYTLEDLEDAKKELDAWNNRFSNDSSNNPNKYSSQIRHASRRVQAITEYLKSIGKIEQSEKEIFEQLLDEKFPNARSKQIVEYNGIKYMKRFYPIDKSNSGKAVYKWGRTWEVQK